MNLDDVINRAVPIYDKDCPAGKCEIDCRLSIDYKKLVRARLKREILEFARQYAASDPGMSYVERLKYEKKSSA